MPRTRTPTTKTTAPEDLELAALARAGDRDAREALWRRWWPCARAAANRYLRLRPGYARYRDDLEAEAAMAVWLAIPQFDPARGRLLSTYLIGRAYYALLDYGNAELAPGGIHVPQPVRRARGRDEGPACWEAEGADRDALLEGLEAPEEGPAGHDAELLARLVPELPDRAQAVLRLWYGFDPIPGIQDAPIFTANRPTALIARHLGRTPASVRQIHADAIARLRAAAGCCGGARPAV